MVTHVDRRHGHNADHHDLRNDHHRGAQDNAPALQCGCSGCDSLPGDLCRRLRCLASNNQRVWPQKEHQDGGGQQVGCGGQHEGPGEHGYIDRFSNISHRADKVRPGNCAKRCGDENGTDRLSAALRSGQVGAGIACLKIR